MWVNEQHGSSCVTTLCWEGRGQSFRHTRFYFIKTLSPGMIPVIEAHHAVQERPEKSKSQMSIMGWNNGGAEERRGHLPDKLLCCGATVIGKKKVCSCSFGFFFSCFKNCFCSIVFVWETCWKIRDVLLKMYPRRCFCLFLCKVANFSNLFTMFSVEVHPYLLSLTPLLASSIHNSFLTPVGFEQTLEMVWASFRLFSDKSNNGSIGADVPWMGQTAIRRPQEKKTQLSKSPHNGSFRKSINGQGDCLHNRSCASLIT